MTPKAVDRVRSGRVAAIIETAPQSTSRARIRCRQGFVCPRHGSGRSSARLRSDVKRGQMPRPWADPESAIGSCPPDDRGYHPLRVRPARRGDGNADCSLAGATDLDPVTPAAREDYSLSRVTSPALAFVALLAAGALLCPVLGDAQQKPCVPIPDRRLRPHRSEYVPNYTALEKGFYRDEGLDVKISAARARATRSKRIPRPDRRGGDRRYLG